MLLCFILVFFTTVSFGQTIAGFKANGRAVNQGDTINICIGAHIIYESTATNFNSISWRFKNGTPTTGVSTYQDIAYNLPGIDTTWQVASSPTGRDSTFALVRVSDVKPIPAFTFAPDGQCSNVPVVFTNTSSGTGLAYTWDFNDNTTSTIKDPTHQFLSAVGTTGTQTFNVKLRVTNDQFCRDSISKIVTVKRSPNVSLGNADAGVVFAVLNGIPTFSRCDPGASYPFRFVNQSADFAIINRYTIKWGDGSPDSVVNSLPLNAAFTHVYPKGFYELVITGDGTTGCSGIRKYNIFMGVDPKGAIVSIGGNSICSPNLQKFLISGYQQNPPGTVYRITVNDGTPPITFSHPPPDTIAHLFLDGSCGNNSTNGSQTFPNSFSVTLITENPCGINSSSQIPIYVSGQPKAKMGVNPVQCLNKKVTISNTSTFGGTVVPTGGGNSVCENTGVTVWSISPATGYTVSGGSLGSLNGSAINAAGWTPGSLNLDVVFTTAGLYTIKLYIGNLQCGIDSTVRIVCARDIAGSFSLNQHSACGPVIVAPNNTSPTNAGCSGDVYNWTVSYSDPQNCGANGNYSFINGTNASSRSPQIQLSGSGLYTLSLYVYANGTGDCYAVATDTFLVKGKPVVKVNPVNPFCLGTPVNPTATVSNCYNTSLVGYNWTFAGATPGGSSQLTPGTINYSAYGTFPIVLQASNDCGITADTTNAVVISGPAPSGGPDKIVCTGDPVQIGVVPVSGITYRWTPVAGLDNPNISNPTATLSYNGPGTDTTFTYYVTASAGSGCVNIDSMLITVRKKPVITVSATSMLVCAGTATTLTASGGLTYVWSPITGLSSSSGTTVTAAPLVTTTYFVSGTAASGCFASASITVNVLPSPNVSAGLDTTMCNFSAPAQLTGTPAGGVWGGSTFVTPAGVFNPVAAGIGNYILTYTVNTAGCVKTDTMSVSVIDAPVVRAGNDTTFCQDSTSVQLAGSPVGGRWTGPSVTLNGLFNTTVPGTYQLVYVFGAGLCVGRDTVMVTVSPGIGNNLISADQSICSGAIPASLTGQVITGGFGTPVYQWQSSLNNNTWANIAGATGRDFPPGALTQTTWFRRIASNTVCSGLQANTSQPVKITINPDAKAEFNPTITSGCPPFSITPSIVNLTTYNSIVSEYRWYANGVYLGSGQTFPGYVLQNNNDSVTIKLVTISVFGCKSDSLQYGFKAAGSPLVSAGNDTTVCQGGVPFQLAGSPAGGRWTGTNVSLSGLFTPSTAGTYTLTYTYGSGSCISQDQVVVMVSTGITNNIISGPQTICSGTVPTPLTGQNIAGGVGVAQYQWQSSTDNIFFTNINGAVQKDYSPGALTQTTWFRREATTNLCAAAQSNTSIAVLIIVNPNATASFNPPINSGCPPFNITPSIINLTPFNNAVAEYRWYANGAYIGSGQTFPGYTLLNNNDTVTIKLVTISAFGCKNDSTQHGFSASGTPTVVAGPDTIICLNSFPLQLGASPAGGRWTGSPYITVAGVFTPSVAGTYTVYYTYGSGSCIATDSLVVQVAPAITNNIVGVSQTICTGTAPAVLAGQQISGGNGSPVYQWQLSTDSLTWSAVTGGNQRDYTPGVLTQTTWYRRIASTTVCTGLQAVTSPSIKITVNSNARAVFTPTTTSGCVPFTITPFIINLSSFSSVSEYRWYVNNNYVGSGQNFPGYTITNNNDSITIRLVAVSAFGCKNDTTEHGFVTGDAPVPAFSPSDTLGCGPLRVTFTNITPNATRYNFIWNFGNNQVSTLVQPAAVSFLPAVNGGDTSYLVQMTATTSCDTLSVFKTIIVRGKPGVGFAPDRVEGCSPMPVTFTNTTRGSGITYVWNFGDGSPLLATNDTTVQHTFTTGVRTVFPVKLRAVNSCGTDSLTVPVTVNANAIRVFYSVQNNELVGCAPHTVKFINNTVGASSFRYDFGDGTFLTSTRQNDTITHVYSNIGQYTTTMRATGVCNDTTGTLLISVRTKPAASFSAVPLITCLGDSVRFNNTSDTATNSFWRFGDGTTSLDRNPVKSYASSGTYRVWLVLNWRFSAGGSCADSVFQDIYIRDTLQGTVAVSDSISSCIPFTATFRNLNGPSAQTSWDFGDGSTATGDSASHTYTVPGIYKVVMITRSQAGCTFKEIRTIRVNAPTGSLVYKTGFACLNENIQFEVRAGNASQYRFYFGDGDSTTSPASVVFHQFKNPGRYLPYALLLDGSCSVRISRGDTIKVDRVVAGFTSSSVRSCGVTTVQFTDTSNAYFGTGGWLWDFGDGTQSSLKNPIKNYTRDGIYFVRLLATGISGCTDTVRIPLSVSIRQFPVATIGGDSLACTGKPINLAGLVQSQDSVTTVSWSFGNNTFASGYNVSPVFNVPATYTVRLIVTTQYGCTDTTYKTIRVNASPVVNAGADMQICRGQSAPLNAFGAATYNWSPIQNLSCSTCASPVASPLFSTQYILYGTSALGCTSTDTVRVEVVQPFRITVSPDDTICVGEKTQLFASGATRYTWNPIAGLSSGNIANPVAAPPTTTRYMVIGNDAYTCFADTGYVTVVVGPYPTVTLGQGATVLVSSSIQLNPVTTNGPIRNYLWTPADDLSCTTCPRPIATINRNITYKLEVENIYGCKSSDTINYKVKCDAGLQVYVPNAFSPDGDGLNDVLMVRGKGLAMVKYFRVFNRWGQMVFEKTNFAANDRNFGWDGRINGTIATPEVYVYTVEVMCAAGDLFVKKGNVTLVR